MCLQASYLAAPRQQKDRQILEKSQQASADQTTGRASTPRALLLPEAWINPLAHLGAHLPLPFLADLRRDLQRSVVGYVDEASQRLLQRRHTRVRAVTGGDRLSRQEVAVRTSEESFQTTTSMGNCDSRRGMLVLRSMSGRAAVACKVLLEKKMRVSGSHSDSTEPTRS